MEKWSWRREEKWGTTEPMSVYTMRRKERSSQFECFHFLDMWQKFYEIARVQVISLVGCSPMMASGLADFANDRPTDRPVDCDN